MATEFERLKEQYRNAKAEATTAYEAAEELAAWADTALKHVNRLGDDILQQVERDIMPEPLHIFVALHGEEIIRNAVRGKYEEWNQLADIVRDLLREVDRQRQK